MSEPAKGSLAEAVLSAIEQMDVVDRQAGIRDAARKVDPDDLTRAMADQDNHVRRNVAMEMLTARGAQSVPALVRSLRDPDPEVVMFAANVMGRSRDPAAIPHLVALLEHEDINVAQAAIDGLSQLRPAPAVDALTRVFDRDPWLRFAAVHALGEIGDPRAIDALLPLLDDEAVREPVMEALGKIGTPEALAVLVRLLGEGGDSTTFATCLRAIGELLTRYPDTSALDRVAEWVRLSTDPDSPARARILLVLAPEGNELRPSDDEIQAKGAAASVVSALRMRPLYTALIMAGRHPGLRDLLQYCAVSLGEEIAPAVSAGLTHFNQNVRTLACRCAGGIGLRKLAPRIAALLGGQDADELQIAAIEALWRLNDDASVPAVVRSLGSESAAVRAAAVAGLKRMSPEAVTSAILREAFVEPVHRAHALDVLRAHPQPSQLPFIRACLEDGAVNVRHAAIQALAAQSPYDTAEILEPLLFDASVDDAARIETIEAVAELREPVIEPLFVRLLADPNPLIRRAATRAAARLGTEAAVRHLIAASRDEDAGVRAEVAASLPTGRSGAQAALERLGMDPVADVRVAARLRLNAPDEAGEAGDFA